MNPRQPEEVEAIEEKPPAELADTDSVPAFSLALVKWPAGLAALCLITVILFSTFRFLVSTDIDAAAVRERALWITPIFLALYENDGHLVYVNETDLGVKALDISDSLLEYPGSDRPIPPNSSGIVMLGQPIELSPREVLLEDLSLDPARVSQALASGRDSSRLIQRHKKEVVEMPNGETAFWIQVRHRYMFTALWTGLLYVVRDGLPVILVKLSGVEDFRVQDMDGDGYREIVRVADSTMTAVHWDMFKWDSAAQTFTRQTQGSSSFMLWYSIEAVLLFLFFALPFLLVVLLGIRFKIRWMKAPVYLYFGVNLVLIMRGTDSVGVGLEWALLLIVFQLCCISIAFKRFKRKKKKPVPAG
jgi:hypothetical protein